MKRIIAIMLSVLVVAAVFVGCAKQDSEPSLEPTTETTDTIAPTPEATTEPAKVILTDVPETEMGNFPVPAMYTVVDVQTDISVPIDLGFTLYSFIDENGIQYRAFGQKTDPAGGAVIEQGWYALLFKDNVLTADDIGALPAGDRIVVLAKEDSADGNIVAGSIIDAYMIGDEAKPFEKELFEQYNIVKKVLDFDDLNAVPVDDTIGAAEGSASAEIQQGESSVASNAKATGSSESTSKPSGNGGSAAGGSGGGSSGSNSDGKTWHDAVYEQVWVVDVPASSYEEPIYETKEIARCTTCNADISGHTSEHMEQHMLNGENGNWKSETIQVQVGTRTVQVPEQGHYEKKLVKEAGYY